MKLTALVPIIAILLISCSSNVWNVQSIKYTDATYAPKPENFNIETIYGITEKPHIVIAHISVNQKAFHGLSFDHLNPESAIAALKNKARELGADAIMNFQVHVGSSGTVGAGIISGQGVAVKWK
jgi:Putative heavy-metal-binding